MSIGHLNTFGDQNKNTTWQLKTLQGLAAIAAGVAPPGGLATEATALAILATLQNSTEFEQLIVMDLGGVGCPAACPTYIQIRIWDPQTQTFGPPVYYNAAGAVVVPVGPLQFVNPQYVLDNMLVQLTAINADLDVALSTRNAEATQLLIHTLLGSIDAVLDAIKVDTGNMLTSLATEATLLDVETAIDTVRLDTANLDVALSTRNAEATQLLINGHLLSIDGKLNTLGQKNMAGSVPVVLASDQSAVPMTLPTGIDTPSVVNAVVNGSTTAGVKSVSMWFRGANGSAGGVGIPNNGVITFTAEPGRTLAALAYVVPTTLQARIILTYTT